jgi:hypothetical protein
VSDEEDLVQFVLGKPLYRPSVDRGIVTVDGFFIDVPMESVVIIVLQPQPEGLVEVAEADTLLHSAEEAFSDCPEEAFNFSTGWTVVGL